MNFIETLEQFRDYTKKSGRPIKTAVAAVTERYARRRLRVKAPEPLQYQGIKLRCIGSKRWRQENIRD